MRVRASGSEAGDGLEGDRRGGVSAFRGISFLPAVGMGYPLQLALTAQGLCGRRLIPFGFDLECR